MTKKKEPITLLELIQLLNHHGDTRRLSAWQKGVCGYASEMVNNIIQDHVMREKSFVAREHDLSDYINHVGARGIHIYTPWDGKTWSNAIDLISASSERGNFEIYDGDIVKRLCAPWEIKKYEEGRLYKNGRRGRNWLQIQSRAIVQAVRLIRHYIKIDDERRAEND